MRFVKEVLVDVVAQLIVELIKAVINNQHLLDVYGYMAYYAATAALS